MIQHAKSGSRFILWVESIQESIAVELDGAQFAPAMPDPVAILLGS